MTLIGIGEWEYEIEPFKPQPKERPYAPPQKEPIEYLIEELRVIWEPRPIGVYPVAVTSSASNSPKKESAGGEKAAEVKVVAAGEKTEEGKQEKECHYAKN